MICVIYEAADRKTAVSISEAAFESAGRSVLACYDKELQQRYDLFGYELNEEKTESMIRKMVSDSLKKTKIGNCKVLEVQVEESAFSLADPEIFMDQLREIGKRSVISDVLDGARDHLSQAKGNMNKEKTIQSEINKAENPQPLKSDEEHAEENAQAEQDFRKVKRNLTKVKEMSSTDPTAGTGDRTLRNGRITSALPSVAAGSSGISAFSGGSVIKDLSEGGLAGTAGDDMYMMSYIHGHFQNKVSHEAEDHFFNNEMEYILFGKYSDAENYRKVYQAIFAIREAANIAYLYTDTAKREEALAAAEALTPGPFAPATQLLLIAAWAALESANDMANLEHGNGVPMMKSRSTWVTTIGMVTEYTGNRYIPIPGNSDMTYEKYLDILYLTVDKKTRLYRIMDLIQINMKGAVREDFILADHFTGFSMNGEISKNSHAVSVPGSKAVIGMTHSYWTEGT